MSIEKQFLEVKCVTTRFVRFGQSLKALDNVSLIVPRGQWILVKGHNGAGKSTLLRVIGGRVKSDCGSITIDGQHVENMSPQKLANMIFYVHQDPFLGTAPALTVLENLSVADYEANLHRVSKRLQIKKYLESLEAVGIAGRLNQPVRFLSGGERQLIAVLVALLRPSPVVLLDEPLAALDPQNADLCIDLIRSLNRHGKTLIQVGHDWKRLTPLVDRTIVLDHGRILEDTTYTRSRAP
jgi:putative tryptophan/tyrosine transport system ATP-binding protein